MSVDKYRGTHHINIISPGEITILLSAQSYRPDVTAAIKRIKTFNWKTLQELVVNKISPGPHPKYGGDYPCLKTRNVSDLIATLEPADYANVDDIDNLERLTVKQGDLLINLTGAGSIGRVSVYYGNILPITNQHIARMTVDESYDEAYVAAFLRSWWGERVLEQGVAGSTGQINMVNDHVRSIPVVIVDRYAQTYIGNKVRQAELLKGWAKLIESSANKKLDSLLTPYERDPKKFAITGFLELEDRLDPRPYRNHYKSMVNEIKNHTYSEVGDIAKLSSGDPVPSELFGQEGIPLIRIRNVGSNDFIDLDAWLPNDYVKNKQQYNARVGDIVVGMDGIFRAQFFIDYDLPARINQRVAIFRCHDIEHELLCFWLNRVEGQNQLNQWAVKTTVEHTSLDYISRIVIPRFDSTEELNLAKKLNTRRRVTYLSKKCSEAAKCIIEALIEGQLTEAQLIDAQQALEEGDNSKDRDILNKLTDKGYLAEGGKPLFNDLDKLYELLDDAKDAISDDSFTSEMEPI
jgi:type I restriction enzyme S subunit